MLFPSRFILGASLCALSVGAQEAQERYSGSSNEYHPVFSTISASAPQMTLPLSAPESYAGPPQDKDTAVSTLTSKGPRSRVPICIVTPLGWGRDDSSQIMAAAEACGVDGIITLPAPYVYTISKRMFMHLERARLNILGTISFTPNPGYWIENSHCIEFQNQRTAWIVEGEDFIIDGGGWDQGGIQENGQAWYTRAAGSSSQFGGLIPLSIYNSTNAAVTNFSAQQGQVWAFWVQDSRNVTFSGIYMDAANTDPERTDVNFEANTSGLDTLRVNGLTMSHHRGCLYQQVLSQSQWPS
ncbi:pectin lyase fold/virulence factor [Xylariaceae sp. FL0255]|nr:pectin lyase fold/virulence factor [Xylariaceae sp. FL0255]